MPEAARRIREDHQEAGQMTAVMTVPASPVAPDLTVRARVVTR
jgi:hypothetical protein